MAEEPPVPLSPIEAALSDLRWKSDPSEDDALLRCIGAFTGYWIVLADGKIYIINEDGLTTVLKAGTKFEVLAENDLGDYTLSSPAVSGGQVFIRTAQHLYCIGKRAK